MGYRKAQDRGNNNGQTDAPIENEVNLVTRDAEEGLTDEMEDCPAYRGPHQSDMEKPVEGAAKPTASSARCPTFHHLPYPPQVSKRVGEDCQTYD
jgi:hypothetical protein